MSRIEMTLIFADENLFAVTSPNTSAIGMARKSIQFKETLE